MKKPARYHEAELATKFLPDSYLLDSSAVIAVRLPQLQFQSQLGCEALLDYLKRLKS